MSRTPSSFSASAPFKPAVDSLSGVIEKGLVHKILTARCTLRLAAAAVARHAAPL